MHWLPHAMHSSLWIFWGFKERLDFFAIFHLKKKIKTNKKPHSSLADLTPEFVLFKILFLGVLTALQRGVLRRFSAQWSTRPSVLLGAGWETNSHSKRGWATLGDGVFQNCLSIRIIKILVKTQVPRPPNIADGNGTWQSHSQNNLAVPPILHGCGMYACIQATMWMTLEITLLNEWSQS